MGDFAVGDRVVAKAGTSWDEDVAKSDPDYEFILLAGHYGHVVPGCGDCHDWENNMVHVQWEGKLGVRGGTIWIGDQPWHMYAEELEHCD